MEINPPLYMADGCTTPQQDRQLLAALICGEGVTEAPDLLVRPGTTTLRVIVDPGSAFVTGDDVEDQGMYFVQAQGLTELTVGAPDLTDTRFDSVVARINDPAYVGASPTWSLEIIPGFPSPNPTPADVPPSSLLLATIRVSPSTSVIQPNDLTDQRPIAMRCGSAQPWDPSVISLDPAAGRALTNTGGSLSDQWGAMFDDSYASLNFQFEMLQDRTADTPSGNFLDLPLGSITDWRYRPAGMTHVLVTRNGVRTMFARLDPRGDITITHGLPGVFYAAGERYDISCTYARRSRP